MKYTLYKKNKDDDYFEEYRVQIPDGVFFLHNLNEIFDVNLFYTPHFTNKEFLSSRFTEILIEADSLDELKTLIKEKLPEYLI